MERLPSEARSEIFLTRFGRELYDMTNWGRRRGGRSRVVRAPASTNMQQRNRTRGTSRSRRFGWSGVSTAAVVLGLLMILPSSVSATTPVTLKAPFTGITSSGESSGFGPCTGTTSWARSPTFSLTSGHAYLAANSSQPACGSADSYSDAEAFVEYVTSSVVLSGHTSIKMKWTASYSVDLVSTPGPSPQYSYAESQVYVFGYVYDLTNDTYAYSTYSTTLYHTVYSGSLVTSYSGLRLVSFINGTFVKSHSYEIQVYLEIDADTWVYTGTSTASASVNAGTSGKAVTLVAITT
jgi:hypothetical protein